MNISIKRLCENDGSGVSNRPEYVEDALSHDTKVGYREGKPVVEPPSDVDTDLKLGDDVGPLYDHYIRGDNLLLPESGGFLRELFDSNHIESVDHAASELNTDTETVLKAAELHGIEIPVESQDSEVSEKDMQLKLPSGETIPFDPLHPLPLSQLLSDGLSIEEISLYLSEQSRDRVTPAEVREKGQKHNFFSGGESEESAVRRGRTVAADDGEPDSTPW
jgi:hypothetical protein